MGWFINSGLVFPKWRFRKHLKIMNFWIKSGIYKISSVRDPGKFYIGSAVNLYQRRNRHFRELKSGLHYNQKLQRFYNKYGSNSIQFDILMLCPIKDLLAWEQHFLDHSTHYFNICPTAGSRVNCKQSQATKQKISESWKFRSPISIFSRLVKYKS